ncbi:MAG: dethiobiotin synthase [Alphaproteobacteria bacterium]|nr:dethiobiotin synthase [Alphaproteobacteria bacterium]
MTAFFVTATGTDIGKTFVTSGLLRHLKSANKQAAAIKPVISGYDPDKAVESDVGVLLKAMDETVDDASIARLSPWRFTAPLSPDVAAARENREVAFDDLVSFCRKAAATHERLLIEGVGGVMVPLDTHHTVLDWMAVLGFPAVLVTGSYLGALSHALTAVDALLHAGVKIAALVINDSGDHAVPLSDTAATLHRFLPGIELAILPRGAQDLDFAPLAALLFHDPRAEPPKFDLPR